MRYLTLATILCIEITSSTLARSESPVARSESSVARSESSVGRSESSVARSNYSFREFYKYSSREGDYFLAEYSRDGAPHNLQFVWIEPDSIEDLVKEFEEVIGFDEIESAPDSLVGALSFEIQALGMRSTALSVDQQGVYSGYFEHPGPNSGKIHFERTPIAVNLWLGESRGMLEFDRLRDGTIKFGRDSEISIEQFSKLLRFAAADINPWPTSHKHLGFFRGPRNSSEMTWITVCPHCSDTMPYAIYEFIEEEWQQVDLAGLTPIGSRHRNLAAILGENGGLGIGHCFRIPFRRSTSLSCILRPSEEDIEDGEDPYVFLRDINNGRHGIRQDYIPPHANRGPIYNRAFDQARSLLLEQVAGLPSPYELLVD